MQGIEFDPEARVASLEERVRAQREQVTSIEAEMRRNFAALSTGLAEINAKLADTSKPQWQALGVMLTAVVVVGSLAYWPIRETQQRIETSFATFVATNANSFNEVGKRFNEVVSLQQFSEFKNTYENNRSLARVDSNSRFEKLERRNENAISRAEYEQRIADLQRQLNDLKQ